MSEKEPTQEEEAARKQRQIDLMNEASADRAAERDRVANSARQHTLVQTAEAGRREEDEVLKRLNTPQGEPGSRQNPHIVINGRPGSLSNPKVRERPVGTPGEQQAKQGSSRLVTTMPIAASRRVGQVATAARLIDVKDIPGYQAVKESAADQGVEQGIVGGLSAATGVGAVAQAMDGAETEQRARQTVAEQFPELADVQVPTGVAAQFPELADDPIERAAQSPDADQGFDGFDR